MWVTPLILLTLLAALPAPAAWAALPLNAVLDKMEQQQEATQDLTFQFSQRVRRGNFPEERTSGEVQIKKPHQLRVVQTAPQKQVLTSDGVTVWLYTPSQKQQLQGDWKAWVKHSRFPLPLIDLIGAFTTDRWRTHYKVYFGGYEKGLYEIRFKPNKPDDLPLTLWVSETTFLPARGHLEDEGVKAEVIINSIKTNMGLGAEIFDHPVPAGTQTIPVSF